MRVAVIFGGAGFFGSCFAKRLLESGNFNNIYLFDREAVDDKSSSYRLRQLISDISIVYPVGDVRRTIDWYPNEDVCLFVNFAAVRREPGQEDFEYYETNLLGAENVCAWAEKDGCNRIIFTSSVSPYGPSDDVSIERSQPVPVTAYGGSKLAAEKIHQIWQANDAANRQLAIARPGLVFGSGEVGNVPGLIKAVLHRYFFYMDNQNPRKAGTYVRELCSAMLWILERQSQTGERVNLFNMSMSPGRR